MRSCDFSLPLATADGIRNPMIGLSIRTVDGIIDLIISLSITTADGIIEMMTLVINISMLPDAMVTMLLYISWTIATLLLFLLAGDFAIHRHRRRVKKQLAKDCVLISEMIAVTEDFTTFFKLCFIHMAGRRSNFVTHLINNRLDENGLLDEEVRRFIRHRFRVPEPRHNQWVF